MSKINVVINTKKHRFVASGQMAVILRYLSEQTAALMLADFIRDTGLGQLSKQTAMDLLNETADTGAILKIGEGCHATYRLSPKIVSIDVAKDVRSFL